MVFTYCVMGKAGSEDFAKAEALAECLMAQLPAVECEMRPVMTDKWAEAYKDIAKQYGYRAKGIHPLVWAASGQVIGGLKKFEQHCKEKYKVEMENDVRRRWDAVARENQAHLDYATTGVKPTTILAAGAAAVAVNEELFEGHRRFIQGSCPPRSVPPAVEGTAATVLLLNPLPPALTLGELVDQPEEALFSVPCFDASLTSFVVGNLEHGVVAGGCRVLWLVGSTSEALRSALRLVKGQLAVQDSPLDPATRESVERLAPALARTLAVLPESLGEDEMLTLAMHECTRELRDELMRRSVVLASLYNSGALHVECCAYDRTSNRLERV